MTVATAPRTPHVQVIGAGLSGLAAASYLRRAGASVQVVEAADRPGGLIQTRHVPEGLVESAARAFPWSPRTADLFAAAGVPPCFALEQSKHRFIYRGGRPRRWPLTVLETVNAAARVGRAWLTRQIRPRADESVAVWGARALGPAAVRWLLTPALQGIYASPPEALSAAALFGKRRGRGGKLAAPPDGMGQLMDQLHGRLAASGVAFEFGHSVAAIDASRRVVICTNAPAAARLLMASFPDVAAVLRRIRMVSLITATAFFPPRDTDLRGFGVLFPRDSGVEALGAVFNTDMFPGRGALRSETWIYAGSSPQPSEEEITKRIVADRTALTDRSDSLIACYVTYQMDALPVYDSAVIEAEAAVRRLPPTIAVSGNFCGRLGVSNLVDGAAEAASRLSGDGRSA